MRVACAEVAVDTTVIASKASMVMTRTNMLQRYMSVLPDLLNQIPTG